MSDHLYYTLFFCPLKFFLLHCNVNDRSRTFLPFSCLDSHVGWRWQIGPLSIARRLAPLKPGLYGANMWRTADQRGPVARPLCPLRQQPPFWCREQSECRAKFVGCWPHIHFVESGHYSRHEWENADASRATLFYSIQRQPRFTRKYQDLSTKILAHLFCSCARHGSVNGIYGKQSVNT